MDILLQLQSARKNKSFYVEISDLPCNTICRFWTDFHFKTVLGFLPKVEETFNDSFYLAGIIDATFCKRKVLVTYSYSEFVGITSGLGE